MPCCDFMPSSPWQMPNSSMALVLAQVSRLHYTINPSQLLPALAVHRMSASLVSVN